MYSSVDKSNSLCLSGAWVCLRNNVYQAIVGAHFGPGYGAGMAYGWLHASVAPGGQDMQSKLGLILAIAATWAVLSGCVPLVVGAAGAVVIDKVVEQEQGGDGLF